MAYTVESTSATVDRDRFGEEVASPDGVATSPSKTKRELRTWLSHRIPPATPGDLAKFVEFFALLRWATLGVAVVIGLSDGRYKETLIGAALLAAVAIVLTIRPPGYDTGGWLISAGLLAEVALGMAIVELTGFGSSPFLVTLCGAVAIAGFAGSLRILSAVAVLAGLSVVIPTILLSESILFPPATTSAASIQLAALTVLVAGVAGYCRYLVDDSGNVHRGLAAQLESLSKMNGQLLDLHATAEELATPFDLDGSARWVFERMDAQFRADVIAVLLRDPATGFWRVAESKGIRDPGDLRSPLPSTVDAATAADGSVHVRDAVAGLSAGDHEGLYHPLRSRGELLGMLVVESRVIGPGGAEAESMMEDVATAASLAIGNARWLQRLRVLSIEQERTRLARDLHDRISQSMVYLGLEVDRLAELNYGRAVQTDLVTLRGNLRVLTGELRDTLVDLRSDVSEETDVSALLRSYVERVNRRGTIVARLSAECDRRLPTAVERELWQIAREAVANAERHARANTVNVSWQSGDQGAWLEVTDDGIGLCAAKADRSDATSGYGILGMQERADAIRAALTIDSAPGGGTVVTVRWRAA